MDRNSTAILFYECMNYPLPSEEILHYLKWSDGTEQMVINENFQYESHVCDLFSRAGDKSDLLSDYIGYIDGLTRLRRSLPFVKNIYLANSITFNALHEGSDIDLFIIASEGKLRLARFFSRAILGLLGLSRLGRNSAKKFCLSFYVEERHTNLYSLLLQPVDIYFIFRLAHLVPLYSINHKDQDMIRKANRRIKGYFPNHPLKQLIRLEVALVTGNSKFKDAMEILFTSLLGDVFARLIAHIRKPIHYRRQKKMGKKARGITVAPGILKFHMDKRKEYLLRYMNRLKAKN